METLIAHARALTRNESMTFDLQAPFVGGVLTSSWRANWPRLGASWENIGCWEQLKPLEINIKRIIAYFKELQHPATSWRMQLGCALNRVAKCACPCMRTCTHQHCTTYSACSYLPLDAGLHCSVYGRRSIYGHSPSQRWGDQPWDGDTSGQPDCATEGRLRCVCVCACAMCIINSACKKNVWIRVN